MSRRSIPTTPDKQNKSAQLRFSSPLRLLRKRPDQDGEPYVRPDGHEVSLQNEVAAHGNTNDLLVSSFLQS
jgi:hypothetical protein